MAFQAGFKAGMGFLWNREAPPAPLQISTSLPAFEEHLRVSRSRSRGILANARSIVRQFEKFLAGRPCNPATAPELVRQFLVSFQHPAYRYTAIYYLRLFFDFLAWPTNPARLVKLPKINPAASRKFLDPEACQRLFKVLEQHAERGRYLREQVLIHLILFTGLRAGEALALRWEDIGNEGCVLIRDSKTHTSRVVYLPRSVLQRLQQYRGTGPTSPWVFPGSGGVRALAYGTLREKIKRLLQEAGIHGKGLNLHSLRHTYARACVEGGLPREVIQQFLGHRNIETTAIYTQLFAEDLRGRSPAAHRAVRAFLGQAPFLRKGRGKPHPRKKHP